MYVRLQGYHGSSRAGPDFRHARVQLLLHKALVSLTIVSTAMQWADQREQSALSIKAGLALCRLYQRVSVCVCVCVGLTWAGAASTERRTQCFPTRVRYPTCSGQRR